MKTSSGFTLISFILVIAIIGFIAVIALPSIGSIASQSKEKELKADLRILKNALEFYFINWGDYPDLKQNEWEDPDVNPLFKESPRLVYALPEDVFNPGHSYQYDVKLKGEKFKKNTFRLKSLYALYTKGPSGTGNVTIPKNTEDEIRLHGESDQGYITNARLVVPP